MTPEILRGGEVSQKRFDPKSVSPFVNKSVSESTRRAYGRALREFFLFAGMKHPSEVVPQDAIDIGVPAYRDPREVGLASMLALPFGEEWPTWCLDGTGPEPARELPPGHSRRLTA